ncbi:MAG: lipoyl(octanoyl) transferase LipB [Mariprofundus sp.]|nr:lipoyl(octanoyl) transferase LipB [Mariprofundus sp.]
MTAPYKHGSLEQRWLGRQAYEPVWALLQKRANAIACDNSCEVIFSCEHDPVYTTGKRGVDNRSGAELPAPVVYSDRGGEMTFHGPGQIMLYPVIHLRKRGVGVKQYVHVLEQSCIDMLKELGVDSGRHCGFPGVWTEQGKIAALGIRITHGVAYHGMALNVNVDTKWFAAINPCGLQTGVVSLSDFIKPPLLPELAGCWQHCLNDLL